MTLRGGTEPWGQQAERGAGHRAMQCVATRTLRIWVQGLDTASRVRQVLGRPPALNRGPNAPGPTIPRRRG